MGILLELRDVSKQYGNEILLDSVSEAFYEDRKVGLIGRNGAGKTTLARLLIGEEMPDSGTIFRHRELRLAYLRQDDTFQGDESLASLFGCVVEGVNRVEGVGKGRGGDSSSSDHPRSSPTLLSFLQEESGQPEWKCAEVAARFEFENEALCHPVDELSGGWRTRLKLTALLLREPNFLLLDEPTNFLDLRTQLLLESFLQSFRGGCLVISHDRAFLQAVTNHTLELSRGRLFSFPGNVEAYLEQKKIRQLWEERYNANVLARRRQLQAFIDKNRADARTASQARNKQKQLERLTLIEVAEREETARLRLPEADPRKGTAFLCENLAIGYPGHLVARGISLDLPHGRKIVVVGDNGQGKTTFFATITGGIPPLQGTFQWTFGCRIGVYAQYVYAAIPSNLTVREYLLRMACPGTTTQRIQDVAGGFLFHGEAIEKPIAVLSGGERARVCLAGLCLQGHNVLVMDEPANHLDVETTEILAEALVSFRGMVLFTSHHRAFTERIAEDVLEVRDGRIRLFPGDYRAYCETMQECVAEKIPSIPSNSKDRPEETEEKTRSRERYRLQREAIAIERQIAKIQEEMDRIDSLMTKILEWEPLMELQQKRKKLERELAQAEETWLELQEQLERLSLDLSVESRK